MPLVEFKFKKDHGTYKKGDVTTRTQTIADALKKAGLGDYAEVKVEAKAEGK